MKLSYSEKIILLVFVLIMTLFVGFRIVIMPEISHLKTNKQLYAEQQAKKEKVNNMIASIDGLIIKQNKMQKKVNKLLDFYYVGITNDVIDQFIRYITNENCITIDSMNLQSLNTQEISFYDPNVEDEAAKVKLNVECATAVITFNINSQRSFEAFIDAVDKQDKAIIIASCSLNENEKGNDYNATVEMLFYSAKSIETILSEDLSATE
jgi:hypothetical protein